LEPELRTNAGAKNFAFHLLAKAAERLRRNDYYCRRLGLYVSFCGDKESWSDEIGFHETWDTNFLLARLENLWAQVPPFKPLAVSVVLMGLVPASAHQPDLFASGGRNEKLSPLVDEINARYGRGAIGFGLLPSSVRMSVRGFKGHAAFQRVPKEWEF
jgi:DNA polymerase IV